MSRQVRAHFIGVGGAGMSGIALVLHERGIPVTGSDLKDSRYVRALREAGVPVTVGHDARNLGDPEVVVVSTAIPQSNPELVEAHRRGLPVWPRARMLAYLAEDRQTIAIAGTHGKTTTSSMVATMLNSMGLSPTFLIGGEVCEFKTNALCGAGPHYVVEADESDGSFLHLDPFVSLVTNIEADHLDHYGTVEAVEEIFQRFMERTVTGGHAIVCADDTRAMAVARKAGVPTVSYGQATDADVRISALHPETDGHSFVLTTPDGLTAAARIRVPGIHNALNAAAALSVAYVLGLDLPTAAAALDGFAGVKRRFDPVGSVCGIAVFDDYAHHPTEVRATLAAARTSVGDSGRVWAIFQPHRYSRTRALAEEFALAFSDADRVILMDVYSAGETPIPGVSGKTLVDGILADAPRSRVAWLPRRSEIPEYISRYARPGDLVMTMGAGDVTGVGPEIVRCLEERS